MAECSIVSFIKNLHVQVICCRTMEAFEIFSAPSVFFNSRFVGAYSGARVGPWQPCPIQDGTILVAGQMSWFFLLRALIIISNSVPKRSLLGTWTYFVQVWPSWQDSRLPLSTALLLFSTRLSWISWAVYANFILTALKIRGCTRYVVDLLGVICLLVYSHSLWALRLYSTAQLYFNVKTARCSTCEIRERYAQYLANCQESLWFCSMHEASLTA